MANTLEKVKILIVDYDWQLTRRVTEHAEQHGFQCRVCNTVREARKHVFEWQPKVILSDLILSDGSGLDLLKTIQSTPGMLNNQPKFLLMSAHNQTANVKGAINKGVHDYIVKPFKLDDLLQRIYFHCKTLRTLPDASMAEAAFVSDEVKVVHQIQLLLTQSLAGEPLSTTLTKIVHMLSIKSKAVRISLLECVSEEKGIVVISSDNTHASGLQLDLNKYPEVLQVAHGRETIAIENISTDAELNFIKSHLKNIDFNSMVLCPVFKNQELFGVLSVRFGPEKKSISDNEIRFIEVTSRILSLTLSQQTFQNDLEVWNVKAA